jgi:ABC-2 type transport system ATP-binding protein
MLENGSLVQVEGVGRRYGTRVGVEDVSLSLAPGEIFGLIGANGGGKTTTLRILAGILRPDTGRGHVLGFALRRDAAKIRKHVGYMAQRLSLYADLSVRENLRFRAEVYGLAQPKALAEAAIEEFGIGRWAGLPAARLSGGWARQLQLAASLLHAPRLVLLDEPTAGLDAIARQQVWRRIAALAAGGAGILVSTHDLSEAERCGRAAFFSNGRVLAEGAPLAIAEQAPAAVFLLSGAGLGALAPRVDALAGVIASHPQGGSLRVVVRRRGEESLRRLALECEATLSRVPIRLEDAALVLGAPERDA